MIRSFAVLAEVIGNLRVLVGGAFDGLSHSWRYIKLGNKVRYTIFFHHMIHSAYHVAKHGRVSHKETTVHIEQCLFNLIISMCSRLGFNAL